jgi:hypothetical protein
MTWKIQVDAIGPHFKGNAGDEPGDKLTAHG